MPLTGPPTPPMAPPMEHKPFFWLPSQTSKVIQIFLLTVILLLPDVDPVLVALINSYLWPADTNTSTPLGIDVSPTEQPPHSENIDHENEPNVLPLTHRRCEPAASSTDEETNPSGLWSRRSRTSISSNTNRSSTRSAAQLSLTLSEPPSIPTTATEVSALYPTPPISNPSTRPLSIASSTGSEDSQTLPSIAVRHPSVPSSDGSDREVEAEDDDNCPDLPLLVNGPDAYVIVGHLGTGASGRVMYARSREGKAVAVKVAHKAKLYRERCGRLNIKAEQECLERVTLCGKPFLTQLLSSWDDDDNVYFVMRMYHENLLQRLHRGPVSAHDLKIYVAELISALCNVHASGVVHRDIKPENVLISPSGHLALADFGLAFINKTDNRLDDCLLTDIVGTPGYWAPEVATSSLSTGYNFLADVWSMGLVIFEMYHGATTSFYGGSSQNLIIRDMMFNDVPLHNVKDDGLRRLLRRMLARNPMHRSTAKELKDDPYFADIDWYLLATGHYKPEYWPTFPTFDKNKASIRFSSFHFGLNVTDGESVHLTREGLVTPNSNVLRQLRDDRLSTSAQFRFRFPLKRVHSVLHEGSRSDEVEHSDDEC
ncbi:hypothetical protein PHLGIDRAFT_129405 [Phlebiopsis gigantea 11061_1 CR5-6]|uniref:non-specific serine/threonine protein kinase n=1 Tax=Phlebiopsis gigantea (strain 11061_1 CR5-6) TaxID=745531 RepID=A0A0C3RUC9_PHLG1|nr:hypothetical protein PHLGIDRAFT_129405 [Phlebiopsis gigantea 11061_1 CR5-6]